MKEEEYNRFKDDLASLREMERILQASLESKERDVEELKRSLEGTFNDLKNTRNELAAKGFLFFLERNRESERNSK